MFGTKLVNCENVDSITATTLYNCIIVKIIMSFLQSPPAPSDFFPPTPAAYDLLFTGFKGLFAVPCPFECSLVFQHKPRLGVLTLFRCPSSYGYRPWPVSRPWAVPPHLIRASTSPADTPGPSPKASVRSTCSLSCIPSHSGYPRNSPPRPPS